MTGPRMRAGDADRQSAVDRLAQHFTAGRLAIHEYDERVGQAYSTVYLDELPALFEDLPTPLTNSRHTGSGGYRTTGPAAGQGAWSEVRQWRTRSAVRRPGPFTGPPPRVFQGALAVFVVLGMLFMTMEALEHGFVPIPLIVLAVFLLVRRSHRREHWTDRDRADRAAR